MSAGLLYTFRRCPYAMRARLALAVADIDVEVREILLAKKPAAFLTLSPKGTVPVLQLDSGPLLEESLDIMRWALNENDPQGWLETAPIDDVLALIATNDGPFKSHLDRYKYPTRYDDADPVKERVSAVERLLPLEKRLSKAHYLFGEKISLADAAIFPFVRQFANVEPERFAQELPALERWRQGWQSSTLFKRIMPKLPAWKPGDEPTFFSKVFG